MPAHMYVCTYARGDADRCLLLSLHVPSCPWQAVAVEKPVATSVEDILECHSVCRANDVPLYCSFQRYVCVLLFLLFRPASLSFCIPSPP